MDKERLHEILNECTIPLRKGDVVHSKGRVVTIDAMPHHNEARPDLEQVDCHFIKVGVDKAKAEQHRAALLSILTDYPEPDRLALGPSYIEVGAVIGDQGVAFQLFALGKVLGLWDVITPAWLGMKGPQADQMAGLGYVMMTGLRPQAKPLAAAS